MKLYRLYELKTNNPNLVRLAVVGSWKGHKNGEFQINKSDLEQMKENFEKRNIDLVIDYEHQSLSGKMAPASGWIKKLFINENELLGEVQWTKKASELIKNEEYKYISPVFAFNSIDEKTGDLKGVCLHSASLTNTPFLDELGEVVINKGSKMEDKDLKITQLEKKVAELNLDLAKKDELIANTKVENAINLGKISLTQKDWALAYCKKDLAGFDEFLKTKIEISRNDMFVNKEIRKDMDIIKMALGD